MNKSNNNNRSEFNLHNLFMLLKLHARFIIIFIIAFLMVVLVYSYIMPEEYRATASLIPPEEGSRGGLSDYLQSLSGGISLGGNGQANKIQLIADYIKSREVAKSTADSLDLYNQPLFRTSNKEALYNAISSLVEVDIKKSGLLLISTTVRTPWFPGKKEKAMAAEYSAKIANASIVSLDKLNRAKSTSKARRKRIFIERILAEKRHTLDSVDLALESFQNKNKVLALDNQTQAIVGNTINIGSELQKAEIDLALKKQEYSESSPLIKTLQDKINNLTMQYQKSQGGGLVSNDNISIPLTKVPELIRVYTNLMRDQKILEQVNLYLETQKYQEAIQEESDVTTVEPLDKAQVPDSRHSPDRKFMLILGFILSSFFAVSIVVGRAIWQGHIYFKKSEMDASESLKVENRLS